jgi:hypothetical protein
MLFSVVDAANMRGPGRRGKSGRIHPEPRFADGIVTSANDPVLLHEDLFKELEQSVNDLVF